MSGTGDPFGITGAALFYLDFVIRSLGCLGKGGRKRGESDWILVGLTISKSVI
jgi:hypothetical protein